jgi:hypothetical protein
MGIGPRGCIRDGAFCVLNTKLHNRRKHLDFWDTFAWLPEKIRQFFGPKVMNLMEKLCRDWKQCRQKFSKIPEKKCVPCRFEIHKVASNSENTYCHIV